MKMTIRELFQLIDLLDGSSDGLEPEGPCDCSNGGAGYLLGQSYGSANIPDEWTPVQRCDTCQVFDDDEDAARAAGAAVGAEVRWFPGTSDDDTEDDEAPGDWAIRDNAADYDDADQPQRYRLTIHAWCDATSESAARQCWIDGDYAGQTLASADLDPGQDATPPHGIEITPGLRAAMNGNTL